MPRFATAALIWSDRGLRAAALMVVLLGALSCTFGPYMATLAVQRFALGDWGYSALLAISTAVSVTSAVLIGIRSDQTGRRRGLALWGAGLMVAAGGLMAVWPTALSFVLVHGLILPMSTLFGQIFAIARIGSLRHPEASRAPIMATIRALFALPFVVVLPLWALAFRQGTPLLTIYPAATLLALTMLAVAWVWWPADASGGGATRSGLSLRAALAEMAHPSVAWRVVALGAVNSSGTVYWAVLSLVLVPAVGRSTADVALYAGIVAGLEVPFMLALPQMTRRLSRPVAILLGTLIYCIHLIGLPLLAGAPLVWALMLPAAAGGALTLTLPIAYLQDLLAERPGTGASLLALQKLIGDLMAAGCFALGTALSGYGLVTVLGAAVTVAGALALVLADRR
jgi:MFS transporter, SET family, sugar efflux transporter